MPFSCKTKVVSCTNFTTVDMIYFYNLFRPVGGSVRSVESPARLSRRDEANQLSPPSSSDTNPPQSPGGSRKVSCAVRLNRDPMVLFVHFGKVNAIIETAMSSFVWSFLLYLQGQISLHSMFYHLSHC